MENRGSSARDWHQPTHFYIGYSIDHDMLYITVEDYRPTIEPGFHVVFVSSSCHINNKEQKEKHNKRIPSQHRALPDWSSGRQSIYLVCNLVHRTLHLPLKPVGDARLVEFAKTSEAGQGLPDLVVFHANRALGDSAVRAETIFLGGRELEHARHGGAGPGRHWAPPNRPCWLGRRGPEALDAMSDVRFARLEWLIGADRWEMAAADGAQVFFGDGWAAW